MQLSDFSMKIFDLMKFMFTVDHFGNLFVLVRCKPMDAEDCEPFTDVYWIKFTQVSNARLFKII